MQSEVDAYLSHLRNERQMSAHTLDAYWRDLGLVIAFCEKQQCSAWGALRSAQVRQLIAEQHRQGKSSRSLARLLSSLRGLYRYLNQEGRCDHDPAAGISAPKGEKRLPRLLDTDRAMQLLDGGVEDDFIGHRDQAMLELFYSSGLRLAELVGLNVGQLDLPAGLVQVQGKATRNGCCPLDVKREKRWKPGCRCEP